LLLSDSTQQICANIAARINRGPENAGAEWENREEIAGLENAGVEKSGAITDGKP